MKKTDFNSMLPSEGSHEFEKAKQELPYTVLIEYADAVSKKYKSKLRAFVTESSQIKQFPGSNEEFRENLVISLSLEAAIGNGYLYRLMEIEQIKNTPFPVRVKVFRDHASVLGTYKDYESFYSSIVSFLDSGIVRTIILNLLAQVDLYNESRNQRFDQDDDLNRS